MVRELKEEAKIPTRKSEKAIVPVEPLSLSFLNYITGTILRIILKSLQVL